MLKDILIFIIGKITRHNYVCDRCQDLGYNWNTIGLVEYLKNHNKKGRYCTSCWNWINLKKWNCECGNSGTLRTSHQNLITCMKCYRVAKCQ